MKLKTKLLPLLGVAALTATIAPLVTSCKLSKMDMVDITKGYYPTTKASVKGEATQQVATQTYINDVKTNPDIFRQDFLHGVSVKVDNIKTEFLNSPNLWPNGQSIGYVSAANFKLNSLKAGVTTPTFGSTLIAYPGEPSVTYPTISFEYSIQIEYTYEYLGWMIQTGEQSSTPVQLRENEGYHSRTITLETNAKYTNVPFLAIAHTGSLGTYWQVSPLDTISVSAEESGIPTVHYYNQAYMYQYMEDEWSIDVNASTNIQDKFISAKGDNSVTTKTPQYNLKISSWDQLSEFAEESSISSAMSYDLANYYDMMISFANFGFESYYLSSVAQKPEIQASGSMEGYAELPTDPSTSTKTDAYFGTFYLPQAFTGTVELFDHYKEDGITPEGAIVLENTETLYPMTLTLGDDNGFKLTKSDEYGYQYGVEEADLDLTSLTTQYSYPSGYYYFTLPNTVVARFTADDTAKTTWTQTVYLNQNTLPIYLEEVE